MQFWNDKSKDVSGLLNSESEVNAITLAYAAQLGFKVQKINIGAQKINRFLLVTYGIVIATFYLLANISMKVVPGMVFLTFSNDDI